MTVKDLVLSHARVLNPWKDVQVIVHIFNRKENYPITSLSGQDAAIEYGCYEIQEWFCSDDIEELKQKVEIYILIKR